MSKSKYLLLFVLPDRSYLAGFSGGKTPLLIFFQEKKRSENAMTYVDAVEEALLGVSQRLPIFILSAELWTQVLRLQHKGITQLKLEEQQQAIAFEAEIYSGISASDSKLHFYFLDQEPDTANYWFVQTRQDLFQKLEQLLERSGKRLLGIAHPGAIPKTTNLFNSEAIAEQRVELWPDCVICVAKSFPFPKIHIIHSLPELGDWEQEADEWFLQQGDRFCETLLISQKRLAKMSRSFQYLVTFEQESFLEEWVKNWGSVLFQKNPQVPIIRASPRETTVSTRLFLSLFFAVFVAISCRAVHSFLIQKQRELQHHLEHLEIPIQKWQYAQKELKSLEEEKKKLEQQKILVLQEQQIFQEIFVQQRHRYAILLVAIRKYCPEDIMIQSIEQGQNGTLQLKGLCLTPNLANQFAFALKNSLEKEGWEVSSTKKSALEESPIWSFELKFTPFSQKNFFNASASSRK